MKIDSSEKRAEIVNAWTAVPGLASTALQAELTDEINPSDLKAAYRRREVLSAILSIKPLSSIDWLSLSGMQLVTDQPMEEVLGSLKLSMLTGPNEGYVMTERGIFGVSLWERFVARSQEPCGHRFGSDDCFPVLRRKERRAGNCGPFFPQNPSRSEGDTRGSSRHRAFAERRSNKTGILASRLSRVRGDRIHRVLFTRVMSPFTLALRAHVSRPGRITQQRHAGTWRNRRDGLSDVCQVGDHVKRFSLVHVV